MRIAVLLAILLVLQLGVLFTHSPPVTESDSEQTSPSATERLAEDDMDAPGSKASQETARGFQRDENPAQWPAKKAPPQWAKPASSPVQAKPKTAHPATRSPKAASTSSRPGAKDPKAIATKQPESVRCKAQEVVRGCKTDRDKAYAIYRYLGENIQYDVDSLFNRKWEDYPPQTAEAVLQRKNAVCAGYSRLFDGMAKSVGLESHYIEGMAYTKPGSPIKERHHAWNSVKWDGTWHVIDCTWGSGSTDYKTRKFLPKPNDDWFSLKPEQFIYSHLPDEPKYLYGARSMTLKEFDALPYLQAPYFLGGYKFDNEIKGYYQSGDLFELPLKAPQDYRILARLEQHGQPLSNRVSLLKRNGRWAVKALFPKPGDYELLVFAGPGEAARNVYLGSVFIHAGAGNPGLLPDYQPQFSKLGLRLQFPDRGLYEFQNETTVRLHRPSADVKFTADVRDSRGNTYPQMTLIREVGPTEVEILARCPGSGRHVLHIFAARDSKPVSAVSVHLQARVSGDAFPDYREDFRTAGLTFEKPLKGLYKFNNEVALKVRRPSEDVEIVAHVSDFDGKALPNLTLVNCKSATEIEILARCPKPGRYRLNIFAGKGGKNLFVASVQLEAKNGGDTFPVLYGNYFKERADLRVGRLGTLKAGQPATVSIRVPRQDHLYFDDGSGEFPEIPLKSGVFTGTVTPRKGKLEIRTRGANGYDGLLKYEVR